MASICGKGSATTTSGVQSSLGRYVCLVTIVAIGTLSVLTRATSPPGVRDLLRDIAQTSDAEWAAIGRGEAVAKVLATDTREVAVAGAVRIGASSERLVGRYRDIESLKRSAIVLEIGRFSKPPRPADLAAVPFEDYNLDLRDCRPGDCRVRLGEPAIARFHREVDWRAEDWREQSKVVWREVLAGYAADHVRGGRRALPTLVNKREPLSVPDEFSLLIPNFAFVAAFSPAFHAYLRDFKPGGSEEFDEIFYWSKEDFGVRPVLRLSHQAIGRAPGTVLIATTQIYADHYLDAGLTVTMALDAQGVDGAPGFYMISVSRARTRSLAGVLRAFVRSTVQSRSRDALRKILASTKSSLEQPQSPGVAARR
jgi:hypothetical protein